VAKKGDQKIQKNFPQKIDETDKENNA